MTLCFMTAPSHTCSQSWLHFRNKKQAQASLNISTDASRFICGLDVNSFYKIPEWYIFLITYRSMSMSLKKGLPMANATVSPFLILEANFQIYSSSYRPYLSSPCCKISSMVIIERIYIFMASSKRSITSVSFGL